MRNRRCRRCTTPADPAVLRKRGNGAPYPPLGGADAFLDFIADDLMPEIGRRLPADPWGNPYQYRMPGQRGAFDVFSFGADGVEGGEGENADVRNKQ